MDNGKRQPDKRRQSVHPLVALSLFFVVAVLPLGDLMEIIPFFAPVTASPFFPFFHEIHDLLALSVVLLAAYKYHARLGVALVLVYLAIHIPYFIHQFPEHTIELLRILFSSFVTLFGIWLINQLHKSKEGLIVSEKSYRTLVENALIGVYKTNLKGEILYVNNALVSMLGFDSAEEMIAGGTLVRYKNPSDRAILISELTEKGKANNFGFEVLTKTGEIKNVILNATLEGNTLSGMLLDIAERKRAEQRVNHLTNVLKAIRNVNQLITHEKDRQNLIQQSCNLLVQKQGYEGAWILLLDENGTFVTAVSTGSGENTSIFLKQLEAGNHPVCVRELLGQEQVFIAYDQPGKRHEGCVLADEHSSRGVFRCKLEYEGKLYGVLGVTVPSGTVFDEEEQALFHELGNDISFALSKIEDEEKLLRVESHYQTMIQTSIDSFLITDANGRFVSINDTFCRLLGYSREELLAMSLQDVEATETREETARHIQRVMESGGDRFDTKYRCRDGGIVSLDISVNYLSTEGLFFVFLRDITEHKRAEEALIKSEENFRHSIDDSPLSIRILNTDGETIYANRTLLDIYGFDSLEELKMTPNKKVYTPESYAEHRKRVEKRQRGEYVPASYAISIVRKDGNIRHLEVIRKEVLWDGKPQFQMLYRDITQVKQLQAQLIMQDRLASIGQLVSGVAHELNNPLTSVIGFSELLLQRELPDDVKADLKVVNDEAKRTSLIVKNLLTFARQQPQDKRAISINESVQTVLQLRSHEQSANNITVNAHFAPDLPQIMGNGSQLQQVFFNIIVNAEQAMLEVHKKGTLTITTEQIGGLIRASFTDDGPGISPENMARLFTPFFTTKGVGKGTGLGLTICQGIITEHGGKIHAESEPGKGATFIIELPVYNKSPQEARNTE